MALNKKKRKESRFRIEKDRKISEQNAVEQVKKFCKMYDIDPEPVEGEVNDNLEAILDAITEYVSLGYLEFKDDFSIVQHLQDPPGDVHEITYNKITGRQKRAMDGFDETEQYAKIYALMGSASGLGATAVESLKGIDLKVMEGLGLTFLS